ncbi:MAG: molybdopterin molybdotransferase MoeA [Flavobacteriaceae bacterium]
MTTYQQALDIIAHHKSDFPTVSRPLEACTDAYLAEDLLADRDFPPFDRVTMDGIAIQYSAFEKGQREFKIEAIAPAGTAQKTLEHPENCVEIMTGAVMPFGADTVIRYEDITIKNGGATINLDSLKHKQNVHFKGIDQKKGSCIVKKGKQLSSAEINIAASIGKTDLKVTQLPKTVIISTGDELVPVSETPELHQIRRSNSYGIKNTLSEWGIQANLEHLPDNKAKMSVRIAELLKAYEVLIFTGGVSKGKFDYLPEVLEELKVQKHFHKIQQRPGKPFWFGTRANKNIIFALPGNPVSSFVCAAVYIRFWLKKSLNLAPKTVYAELKNDVIFEPDLVYFLEAKLASRADGKLVADPVKGNGSGDFANLVHADGFIILPQGKSKFLKGEAYPFIPYRSIF